MSILLVSAKCIHRDEIEKHPSIDVDSWAYQLQNADPDLIASSGFDLIVMDYSRDGTDEGRYTPGEIDRIKRCGVIPIAYISIGEAEDYRFYWNEEWYGNPPPWLGKENPDWPGNYKVRYWDDDWKGIVFEYLDEIMEQGFSGVYLDIIDAFEYWSDPDNGEDTHLSEEEAARKMIVFVEEIAHYCRDIRGKRDFYIIPQNGERILEFDVDGSYLRTISGIGVESLWYDGLDPIPPEETEERTPYLDEILDAGKAVFSVGYVDDGSGYAGSNKMRIDDYRAKALGKGYIPYIARSDMELDELNIIEGVQPR